MLSPEELVEQFYRWHDLLYGTVRLFFKVPEDIDDMLQDIFLKALKYIDNYNSGYAISTWLNTIARNECITKLKYKNRPKRSGIHLNPHDYRFVERRDPLWYIEQKERSDVYSRAINSIKAASTRETLEMRFYDELPYEDISKMLDIPLNTVKTRIYNARRYLLKDPVFRDFYSDKITN